MIPRYILWTESEDNALKDSFDKFRFDFKQGRHGSTISRIKLELNKRGIIRSESGISRRLWRLGLSFYRVVNGEIEAKCKDCENVFFAQGRYITRKINKKIYCNKCAELHKKDWDIEHRQQILNYLKEYNKFYKSKRLEQQRLRRAK